VKLIDLSGNAGGVPFSALGIEASYRVTLKARSCFSAPGRGSRKMPDYRHKKTLQSILPGGF